MTDPLPQGTRVGDFVLGGLVGRGSSGLVYRATPVGSDRAIALKVIDPSLSADPATRQRILATAQTAATIWHPAIVNVVAAGEDGANLYVASRFVAGTDLQTLITHAAPLERERSLNIARQLAGALDAAHDRGIFHGSVKASNVLIERGPGGEETAGLTDFGIAAGDAQGDMAGLASVVHATFGEQIPAGATVVFQRTVIAPVDGGYPNCSQFVAQLTYVLESAAPLPPAPTPPAPPAEPSTLVDIPIPPSPPLPSPPPPPSRPPSRSGRSRTPWLLGGAGTLAVIVVVVVVVLLASGGHHPRLHIVHSATHTTAPAPISTASAAPTTPTTPTVAVTGVFPHLSAGALLKSILDETAIGTLTYDVDYVNGPSDVTLYNTMKLSFDDSATLARFSDGIGDQQQIEYSNRTGRESWSCAARTYFNDNADQVTTPLRCYRAGHTKPALAEQLYKLAVNPITNRYLESVFSAHLASAQLSTFSYAGQPAECLIETVAGAQRSICADSHGLPTFYLTSTLEMTASSVKLGVTARTLAPPAPLH